MRILVNVATHARAVEAVVSGWALQIRCRASRLWHPCAAVALLALSVTTSQVAAQEDCTIERDGWDDVQHFRRCLSEVGLDWWDAPSGRTVLHDAAEFTDNPTVVQLLLEAGADPNAVDDRGLTPLHRGARNSNPAVVSHLLSAGADAIALDGRGRTPLHLGAANSNPVVTARLLAAGADPNAPDNDGYTPLHYAAAHSGNRRLVVRLLTAGVDPLAESNDGRTPLHSALRYAADRGVISAFIEAGADENLAPLTLAVLEADSLAVSSLLAEGIDPNAPDGYGWSALHFAVPLAGSAIVSALLSAGADPNQRAVGGGTALHLAASQAPLDVVSDLLKAGADPNVRDGEVEEGWMPLHYAARRSDPSVVLALLDAGANASLKVSAGVLEGMLPVDVARANDAMTGSDAYPRLLVNRPIRLERGLPVTGALQSTDGVAWDGSYYDEYSYLATAGHQVVVTMESEEVDSYLLVLRSDGTEVAGDDDGGDARNARVSFRAPITGQYTILATSYDSEEIGRYVIRVEG